MLKEASKLFLRKIRIIILVLVGTLSWSLTMIKSGWLNSYGMGFWGANGHDGIWHIALSENLSRYSLEMPIFSGFRLQNYHIGFDLVLAVLHKVTFISTINLYFQIIPPILALLIGVLTYKFISNWTKSSQSAWWSTFFVYFGGSFGWLIGRGESAFWSQQAISTLINPPFALSLVILLVGLILIQKLEQKFNSFNLLLCAVIFGSLIEIKAYAGILALGALFVSSLFSLIVHKKTVLLKVFIGSLIFSLIIYLPLNKGSFSLLVWQPFWFLETMMGLTDRVGWLKFFSAMTTYKSGHIWIKEGIAYISAFIIFLVGNMGARIIFLFRKIKFDQLNIFIYSVIGAGIVIPTFFLQKGTPWNTIQFFYYSLFFSGILAGIAVSQIKNKILPILIILLTIPTTIITLKDVYVPSRPPAMLPSDEIQALVFLSAQPDGVVLTYPFNSVAAKAAENNPPRPLYLYTSTAYVSAFSGKPSFFEDEINLDITGFDWQIRKNMIESWYKESNQLKAREFLKENNIKYIYWVKPQRAVLGETQLGFINIFENPSVIIYQVN